MRWYDHKTTRCDECYHHGFGSFPDGTPYERCSRCGYILHLEKGISDEPCREFQTKGDYEAELRRKELQKRRKK